jgi:acetyl esterase/lipase
VNILPEDGSRTVDDYIPERLITPEAPPHFIWISSGDRTTAPTFALRYAARLCENHVQNEFHMFPGGKHGLGLALDYPEISKWAKLSVEWIRARVKGSAL